MYRRHLVLMDVQIWDSHFLCDRPRLRWFIKGLSKYPLESHVPGVARRPVEPLLMGKWEGEHASYVCSSYQTGVCFLC